MSARKLHTLMLTLAWLAGLAALTPEAKAAEEGNANPACVSRSATGKQGHTQLVNGCADKATVHYCNVRSKISGKRCGDQKVKDSVYYTHLRTLEPGERSVIGYPDSEIRVAVCVGQRSPYRPTGFRSEADGSFNCPPGAKDAAPKGVRMRSSAIAGSRSEACTAARELFVAEERERIECECKVHRRASGQEVHHCQAVGTVDPEREGEWEQPGDMKTWLREALSCDPASDPEQCAKKSRGTAIGVRG